MPFCDLFFDKFCNGKLAGAIDDHKEMQIEFPRSHLSNVDIEIANRVALELLPFRVVTLNIWKTRNTMLLNT